MTIKFSKTLTLSELDTDKTGQADLFQQQASLNVHVMINSQMLTTLAAQHIDSSQSRYLSLDIGVDEAGRGPLLGSVLVGAVILPPELSGEFSELDLSQTDISQLNDSKKISEKKRDALYEKLDSVALAYAYVDVSPEVIDEINILQASLLGMRVSAECLIEEIAKTLSSDNLKQLIIKTLFDGNKLPKLDYEFINELGVNFDESQAIAIVKGDAKETSIAMGSVLAKVTRDKQMYKLAEKYPNYGIEKHKGYPTKQHFQSLEDFGVLAEHRKSFAPISKLLAAD